MLAPPSEPYRWLIALPGLGNVFLPEAEPVPVEELGQLVEGVSLTPFSQPRRTEPRALYTALGSPGSEELELRDFDRPGEFVAAVAQRAGIPDVPLGTAFYCVLPGHDHIDRRGKSASLYVVPEDGRVVYHDWHTGQFFTLPEIYQAVMTGSVRKMQGPEHALWNTRALFDFRSIARAGNPASAVAEAGTRVCGPSVGRLHASCRVPVVPVPRSAGRVLERVRGSVVRNYGEQCVPGSRLVDRARAVVEGRRDEALGAADERMAACHRPHQGEAMNPGLLGDQVRGGTAPQSHFCPVGAGAGCSPREEPVRDFRP